MAFPNNQSTSLEDHLRRMIIQGDGQAQPLHPQLQAYHAPNHFVTQNPPPLQSRGYDIAYNNHQAQFGRRQPDQWAVQSSRQAPAPPAVRQHQPLSRASQATRFTDTSSDRRAPPANRTLWRSDGHGQQDQSPRRDRHGFDHRTPYLDNLVTQIIPEIEMAPAERADKERFRIDLERVAQSVCAEFRPDMRFALLSFGSLQSGFASKGSDMDLAVVCLDGVDYALPDGLDSSALFSSLQERFLESGYGARLLSKTRVPIIKMCEKPTPELLKALQDDRQKTLLEEQDKTTDGEVVDQGEHPQLDDVEVQPAPAMDVAELQGHSHPSNVQSAVKTSNDVASDTYNKDGTPNRVKPKKSMVTIASPTKNDSPRKQNKNWIREKVKGPLDFPDHGVGVQCDINLANALGHHNTHMLRCYAACDPRVTPMVLFVKEWAGRRKIRSSYSGTMSSYGYVLMVLHYLVNVARPPVLPNLQAHATTHQFKPRQVSGWTVNFWSDEAAIAELASRGQLTSNQESIGSLLRGFYGYFAYVTNGFGFNWAQQVLSLRSPYGILTKSEKGWTGAKTQLTDTAVRFYIFHLHEQR